MSNELTLILEELKKTPCPFEKLDELELNENLKAFLRRRILEEFFNTPTPFISSTVTDFAENPVYKGLKPIGSMEKPIGYLGSIVIKTNGDSVTSHLILDLNLATHAREIREAVKMLEKGTITVIGKQFRDGDEELNYLRMLVGNAYKAEVGIVFEPHGTRLENFSKLIQFKETFLYKLYHWLVLFEIYSMLEIPVATAVLNRILNVRLDSGDDKTLLYVAFSTYFTKPSYNPFVEELLKILGVSGVEDIPVIIGVYSLLSLLAFSMKE
ncbi:MAG: hypothetical protein ACPLSM_03620 [Thermosphaera sp.]